MLDARSSRLRQIATESSTQKKPLPLSALVHTNDAASPSYRWLLLLLLFALSNYLQSYHDCAVINTEAFYLLHSSAASHLPTWVLCLYHGFPRICCSSVENAN
jgi:hypothetical protein